MERFTNQKILNRPCHTGDDRVLTNYALEMGYKTVLQKNTVIFTEAPDRFTKFVKQQIRWSRSSQCETLLTLPLYLKLRHYFTAFCFVTDIITPWFLAAVVVNIIVRIITNAEQIIPMSFLASVVMGLIGMNISLGLRYVNPMEIKKEEYFYFFMFTLFATVIMIPIRIYGLLTFYKRDDWMTREINK